MHIGELILKSLKEKERNIAWLARKVNRNDANLGRLLKNSPHIHSELLLRISIALEEDFFAYYSGVVKKSL
jgi:plasmid maintenance system antidote protein VapI